MIACVTGNNILFTARLNIRQSISICIFYTLLFYALQIHGSSHCDFGWYRETTTNKKK